MPDDSPLGVGQRIAYQRSIARPKLTQQQLADRALIHVGTLRKVERGARGASEAVIDAIADALGIEAAILTGEHDRSDDRVHQAMPALSAVIATYDLPDDGPIRPLHELEKAVSEATTWRLGAHYVRIVRAIPDLLGELLRALDRADAEQQQATARLLVSACRSADAVAYKHRAHDLSARLIDLMRWAAPQVDDPDLSAAVAYVRTEVYFASKAHRPGLRALELAINGTRPPDDAEAAAARGALHMRAAVIACRAKELSAADVHLEEAKALAKRVPEGVYQGTAFGPDSLRIHQVSVAVSCGAERAHDAIALAEEWKPGLDIPAERRSGFYIDLARAQLWAGRAEAAFESLKAARRIAPQHTREHPWVREDAATLRRLRRADAESLTNFATWCHAQ